MYCKHLLEHRLPFNLSEDQFVFVRIEYLNKVNVIVVTFPEQNDMQLSGIPRDRQHGV